MQGGGQEVAAAGTTLPHSPEARRVDGRDACPFQTWHMKTSLGNATPLSPSLQMSMSWGVNVRGALGSQELNVMEAASTRVPARSWGRTEQGSSPAPPPQD